MQNMKKMPTPGGIGAGQTATVNLPIGLTYEALFIRLSAKIGAIDGDIMPTRWGNYIGEVRILVDGNVTYQIDAGDLEKMNLRYGKPPQIGVLPIFLSRPWMRTMGGEDQTSYKTGAGVSTLTLELDIKADVTVNNLDIYAQQSPGMAWGTHLRIKRYSHPQSLVGPAEISDLPRSNYNMLALHVNTDKIERAEVVINNNKVVDYDKAMRNAINAVNGRNPITGFTMLDFQSKNRMIESVPMQVQDFRLKLDFTEVGNYTIYAESVAGAAGA